MGDEGCDDLCGVVVEVVMVGDAFGCICEEEDEEEEDEERASERRSHEGAAEGERGEVREDDEDDDDVWENAPPLT